MEEFHSAINKPARRLVVVLPGLRSLKSGYFEPMIKTLHEELPDSDILTPQLASATVWSFVAAAKVAGEVIDKIDAHWEQSGTYDEIVIVGHSSGGAIARKVVVGAFGEGKRAKFESTAGFDRFSKGSPWAEKISRLVLIAGVSSGWRTSGREKLRDWAAQNFFGFLGHVIPNRFTLTVFDLRRGAPFIANTRLQMMDLLQRLKSDEIPTKFVTIQLLGSSDNTISPGQTMDFNAATAKGGLLLVSEVPQTDHRNIIDIAPLRPEENASEVQIGRSQRLLSAIAGPLNGNKSAVPRHIAPFKKYAFDWQHLLSIMPRDASDDVSDVVFVVHGIRDEGHWTKKIASRVVSAAQVPKNWRTVTASYGYFAMLPFVLPWIRQQKVEWLMHEYCEAACRYPNAMFHYVGHSNGTYLAARAMRDYKSCGFERVVFAGSVVRSSYEWSERKGDSGVKAVWNYVATNDKVVALAPNALRHAGLFDLGGAGHVGFADSPPELVRNISYVAGGHDAAIREEHWEDIAQFIAGRMNIGDDLRARQHVESRQNCVTKFLGRLAPFIAVIVLALFCGISIELISAAAGWNSPSWVGAVLAPITYIPGLSGLYPLATGWTNGISEIWAGFPQSVKVFSLLAFGIAMRFVLTQF